eukprot:251627_1
MLTLVPSLSAVNEHQFPTITLVCSFFLWWILDILFEKYLSMEPVIRRTNSLLPIKLQDIKSSEGRCDSDDIKNNNLRVIALKMSHRIDSNNCYRMRVSSSTHFVKMIFDLILFILFLSLGIKWAYLHFFCFDTTTLKSPLFMHIISIIISFYLWEIIMLRKYAVINTSVLIHHWLAILFAVLLKVGIFIPYATLYAFIGVSLGCPLSLAMGFRANYSFKYPVYARKLCKFAQIYFIILCVINIGFQTSLLIYGVFIVQKISITIFVIMIVCISVWLYEDIVFIKALGEFSTQKYEVINANLSLINCN